MAEVDGQTTIPIVEEVPILSKRAVETDRVRVRTIVEEHSADIPASLAREELVVERRPADREVAVAPPPREEGGALIVSVVEERPVVEKRLFVVEELVLRRVARTEEVAVPVTLRTMRAVVERDGIQE